MYMTLFRRIDRPSDNRRCWRRFELYECFIDCHFVILAEKQNVACDFEDTFKCGYTTSTTGSISWERVSGKTLRSSSDHKEFGTLCRITFTNYTKDKTSFYIVITLDYQTVHLVYSSSSSICIFIMKQ